jgi:uncharacterized phage infection (PIP) family protein YhgE
MPELEPRAWPFGPEPPSPEHEHGWREQLALISQGVTDLQTAVEGLSSQVSAQTVTLRKLMTEQQDLDTDVAGLQTAVSNISDSVNTLATAQQAIATEIQNLQSANPQLDLSGLDAAVQQLDTGVTGLQSGVQAVQGLAPQTPPATPPAGQ